MKIKRSILSGVDQAYSKIGYTSAKKLSLYGPRHLYCYGNFSVTGRVKASPIKKLKMKNNFLILKTVSMLVTLQVMLADLNVKEKKIFKSCYSLVIQQRSMYFNHKYF